MKYVGHASVTFSNLYQYKFFYAYTRLDIYIYKYLMILYFYYRICMFESRADGLIDRLILKACQPDKVLGNRVHCTFILKCL